MTDKPDPADSLPKDPEKRELFAYEYVANYNMRAGPAYLAVYGGKKSSAYRLGSLLTKQPEVRKMIAELIEERIQRTKIDSDWILLHGSEILKADIADIIADDGSYLPIKEWPLIWRQMLSGVDVQELFEWEDKKKVKIGEVIKVKFIDRIKTMELMGKHVDVDAFREKHLIETVDRAQEIAEARKRAEQPRVEH